MILQLINLQLEVKNNSLKMPIKINAKGAKLNDEEKWELDKLLAEYEIKLARELKNDFNILVYIKVHEKGKSKKFSISVDVVGTVKFGATVDDYDLAKAIHKVFNKIMSEIEHRLHVSDQNRKL